MGASAWWLIVGVAAAATATVDVVTVARRSATIARGQENPPLARTRDASRHPPTARARVVVCDPSSLRQKLPSTTLSRFTSSQRRQPLDSLTPDPCSSRAINSRVGCTHSLISHPIFPRARRERCCPPEPEGGLRHQQQHPLPARVRARAHPAMSRAPVGSEAWAVAAARATPPLRPRRRNRPPTFPSNSPHSQPRTTKPSAKPSSPPSAP